MKLPTLNMAGWTIDDYEAAQRRLTAMTEAGSEFLRTADSVDAATGDYRPGAAFVESLVMALDWKIDELNAGLEMAEFASAEDNQRRIELLNAGQVAS